MSLVNAEIKMQGNDNAFFTTNAAVVYPANIQIFHTDGRYKFTDGVTALSVLPFLGSGGTSTPLGLIKIIDLNGEFFTDLATATAYIEQFITPSVITDKSFNEGIFFFTVPNSTAINGYFLIDNITPSITFASLIDRFGLLDLTNAQEFGYMNAGHHILGNGLLQNSAFNLFSGTIEMNSLYIAASGGNFAESSTGKFIIKGSIGVNETAQFGVNFFLNSTATIFANASKYTSNAGGIQGDLVTAITNGCNVQFDGIDLEKVSNKSTSVVTDQASNTKYPSVKSVFDWVTSLFATKGNSRPIYSGKRRSIPYVGMPGNSTGNQGNVWYIPYIVDSTHIVTDIGLEVTAAIAATNIRLALYNDNNGVPGSLIEESAAISSASTGLKTHTFATPKTLSASNQIYWMAFQCSAFAVGLRATATSVNNLYITGIGAIGSVYSQSQAFGAFPANATPVNFSSSSSWLVSLKVQ